MTLLLEILLRTLQIYRYILTGRIILSFIPLFSPGWQPPPFLTPVVDLIYGMTEPPLQFIRRYVPQPMGFPFDLSFIVLYVLVGLVLPTVIRAGFGSF